MLLILHACMVNVGFIASDKTITTMCIGPLVDKTKEKLEMVNKIL